MEIQEDDKKIILNYLSYAEFYVSKYLNSVNRIPNIMIDVSDLKSSLQFMENSIKKVIRYLNNNKKADKDVHNIYLASNKQFVYLISLMQSEWSKDYIGLNNSLIKLNFKRFDRDFNQQNQQKQIKEKRQKTGVLRTFIWRVIVAHQLLLKTANILKIPIAERDYIDIIKEINFPKEYTQTGISILNYFGEVVIDKYSDVDISISIQQLRNKVIMVIQTPDNYQEIIEEDLHNYGQVVLGYQDITTFTKKTDEILKLDNKLKISMIELQSINNQIQVNLDNTKQLLISEKDKNTLLQQQISSQCENFEFMKNIFINEKKEKKKLLKLIQQIEENSNKKEQLFIHNLLEYIASGNKELVMKEIETIKIQEPTLFNKINELIIKGGVQGASGNYFFAFLQELSKLA
jgi:hypothetical protein